MLLVALFAISVHCVAQGVAVTGHVTTYGGTESSHPASVVWLIPVVQSAGDVAPVKPIHAVLRQKNKAFEPHLLVVTKGSTVDFPNQDPWFHNVFSLFNGKKFDLGLYEAGTSRTVHFDREGVSYIFCNIHPEMSAVVVVVSSPYYALVSKSGDFSIPEAPSGQVHAACMERERSSRNARGIVAASRNQWNNAVGWNAASTRVRDGFSAAQEQVWTRL